MMIRLDGAAKYVKIGDTLKRTLRRQVLEPTSLSIPVTRRIAFLGPSNPDKLVIINLLAGISVPSTGHVFRSARVSYPVGFTGGFDGKLSVRSNVEHTARLYGADIPAIIEFVRQATDLGRAFDRPLNQLDPQAKQALAWVVTYSIPFDIYLHAAEIRQKANPLLRSLFETRARACGFIAPTRDLQFIRTYCDMALVLHDRRLSLYDDLDFAIALVAEVDPSLSASKRKAAAPNRASKGNSSNHKTPEKLI